MTRENFRKVIDIIKGDDRYDFNECLRDIVDDQGQEFYVSEALLLICYAAEIGSARIFEMLIKFDGINVHAYNDYPLRVAVARGHQEIIDIIDPEIDIALEEVDTKPFEEYWKKINETRCKIALGFESLKDKIERDLKEAIMLP